ncbi:uncharacterized protein LOC136074630 [Hydra vulgaris]|uniref:Uncharacterized protein LOC136074630 n=1 Tax=Hydra vulgaris TaxID=6087 RepID=A0ABM4B2J5_HYDVU
MFELSSECGDEDEFQHHFNLMKHPSKDICQKIAEKLALKILVMQDLIDGKENDVPLKMHACKADGNCFFRAILFLLSGSDCRHECVRNMVVKHMTTEPCSSLLLGYLGDDMESYLTKSGISADGIWVTDVEIFGTANLMGIAIAV